MVLLRRKKDNQYKQEQAQTQVNTSINENKTREDQEWEMIKEKYQFVDKEVELSEAVFFTKAVLSEQIQKIRTGEFKNQAYSLVRKKGKI